LHDLSGNGIPIGNGKSFWVKVLVGNIVLAQNASAPSAYTGGNFNCACSQNACFISEMISLINQARAEVNVPALTVNEQRSAAIQSHSVDMACSNLLSHFGSDGSGWWERINRTGYFSTPGPSVGEILGIGTPQNAMFQWKSDPGLWEFVINPGPTEFGAGYAYYAQSDYGNTSPLTLAADFSVIARMVETRSAARSVPTNQSLTLFSHVILYEIALLHRATDPCSARDDVK
jgi:uncharacterized protein YkwD